MSFSFDFYISSKDAPELIEQQHAPECVKSFIRTALTGITADVVYVKAYGHLYNGQDYNFSNATIEVKPIYLTYPKVSA